MELLIAILVIVVIFIIPNIKVVPQARSYVIERLGSYLTTWNNGLHSAPHAASKLSATFFSVVSTQ